MLGAHYHDRPARGGMQAARQHREQHLLFLLHMRFQLAQHLAQVVGQAKRAIGPVTVHLLDAPRQADQLGQLLAVARMEAREDMFDQLGRRRRVPVLCRRPFVLQRAQLGVDGADGSRIETLLLRGVAQGLLASAAEVQPVAVEDPGGTRDQAGQLAKRVVLQGHDGCSMCKLCLHDLREERA
ncbi:hypothetical protein D3C72_1717420 [compost metagenome]